MVPPNPEKVKANMRKYYKQLKEIEPLTDDMGVVLPSLTRIDQSLNMVARKAVLGPLSSPTRHLFHQTRIDVS